LPTKFIKESKYWQGKGRIYICLTGLLQDVLGWALARLLMIFFCQVKIFPLLEELPEKIIPYFITE